MLRTELDIVKSKINNGEVNNNGNNSEEFQKKYEDLRKKYIILVTKLEEPQENIKKANSVLSKARKYNNFISSVSKLIKEMDPNSDKEIYLYNKLKSIIAEKEEKEKEKEKSEASIEKKY